MGAPSKPSARPSQAWSSLSAGLRVGIDFFERAGATMPVADPPRGLVESLDELAHPDAQAAEIHPDIRAFFERTSELELLVMPSYSLGFGLLARLAHVAASWIGQLVYPIRPSRIETRVVALDPAIDGRAGAHGVIRSYEDSGRAMQIAAYAPCKRGEINLLGVAFPILFGNLAGLLRFDAIVGGEGGLGAALLTSKARPDREDGTGVWLALGRVRVRLPFQETLRFWTPAMRDAPAGFDVALLPGTTIVGLHEQRVLGVRFALHRYYFRPRVAHEPGRVDDAAPAR